MNLEPIRVYIFSEIVVAIILISIALVIRFTASARNPGKFQIAIELVLDGMRDILSSALGEGSEQHLPLVLTFFLYILVSNLLGEFPGFKSATAATSTTIGLGLISFFYVQYVGIKSNGLLGYMKHFAGPVIFLAWLFIPIEIISELAKPFSLGMRLFGNIFGEDVINDLTLHGGILMVPLQVLVRMLQLFTDLVQAFIFAILTSAYISIFSTHHADEGIDVPHISEVDGEVVGRIPAEFSGH
jgi:F-type H+-transporting ATPase subunit a